MLEEVWKISNTVCLTFAVNTVHSKVLKCVIFAHNATYRVASKLGHPYLILQKVQKGEPSAQIEDNLALGLARPDTRNYGS